MKIPNEIIFSILRTICKQNPGDSYYQNYLWHYQKYGDKFYDTYHFAWERVIECRPRRILEIGTRTGISMAQLLSAYMDYSGIERIVSCDPFNDGYISPNLVKVNLGLVGIPDEVIDKIEFMVGDSKNIIPILEDKFDYILVDGSHDKKDAKQDLENVVRLVSDGGVIVFDDISVDGCDLIDVWNEFKHNHYDNFMWIENLNGKGIGYAIKNR